MKRSHKYEKIKQFNICFKIFLSQPFLKKTLLPDSTDSDSWVYKDWCFQTGHCMPSLNFCVKIRGIQAAGNGLVLH